MCHYLPLSRLFIIMGAGVPRVLILSEAMADYCVGLDLAHTDASVSWCGIKYGVDLGVFMVREHTRAGRFTLFLVDFRWLIIGARIFVRIQRFFRKHRARRREQRMLALCMADSALARVVRVLCDAWVLLV